MANGLKKTLIKAIEKNSVTVNLLTFYRKTRCLYCMWPYLDQTGWFKSVIEGLPVDKDGGPLPWFTYSSISFLDKRIKPEMLVFEYGSGNSTLWWSKRVSRVRSCEHDLKWHGLLKGKLPANVEYLYHELVPGGEYSKAVLGGTYDIIVIDGRDRINCAAHAVKSLKKNGIIVWDNTERDEYQEGYDLLTQHGFKRLDFEGHGPIGAHHWSTSIFYRDDNLLGI